MVSAHWFFVGTDGFVPSVVKISVFSHLLYFFVNLSILLLYGPGSSTFPQITNHMYQYNQINMCVCVLIFFKGG